MEDRIQEYKMSLALQRVMEEMHRQEMESSMPGPSRFDGPGATGIGTVGMDANNQSVTAQQAVDTVGISGMLGMLGMAVSPVMGLVGKIGKDVTPISVQVAQQAAAQNANAVAQAVASVDPSTAQAVADAVAAASQDGPEGPADGEAEGSGVSSGSPGEADGPGVWAHGGYVRRRGLAFGGYVDGSDGGMDDTYPTTIEGDQPAALSHGEYVLTADIVSAIGDGNTKAGVKKLKGLENAIRKRKYGRTKQPPRLRAGLMSLLE